MTDARNDPFLTHQQNQTAAQGTSAAAQRNRATALGPARKPRGGSNAASLALLIFLPWLMFMAVMCLFTFPYHHWRLMVWLLVFGCFCLSGIFIFVQTRSRQGGTWYLFLGVLCVLACAFATLFGLYNYYEYMFNYWAYEEYREYNNVLPSEPAAAHMDAGKLIFSSDARVDTTKAVGYKATNVFCVAPVLDDTQASRVEFWAVGVNCCGKRADFNCDDAWNPKARAGVVLLDNASWLPSARDTFMKAVKVAEAAFDVISAEPPILVRWVVDPQDIQEDFWKSGVGFVVTMGCVYLVISVILGAVLHHSSKPKAGHGALGAA